MKKAKIIGIVLLILAIAFGAYLYIQKQYKSDGMSMSGYVLGTGLSPDLTEEEIKEMMQKKVDESKVAFSIYTEPTFNGKRGTIMFANPPYSAHNISVEVVLDNKVIIRTEKIAPDQYIKDIELIGNKLKKGKHNAVAYVKAYDKKTDELVGEVQVDMIRTSK